MLCEVTLGDVGLASLKDKRAENQVASSEFTFGFASFDDLTVQRCLRVDQARPY